MKFNRESKYILPLGIFFTGIVVTYVLIFFKTKAIPNLPSEKMWPVHVSVAKQSNIQPNISIFGEVLAAREAELRSTLSGKIVELNPNFKNGSFLSQGTMLLEIDFADYENQVVEKRADLSKSQEVMRELNHEYKYELKLQANASKQLEILARDLDRTRQLASSGQESKKAIDIAESKYIDAEKDLLLRRQNIGRLSAKIGQQKADVEKVQASLSVAEKELLETQLLSPIDGYISDVRLALGAYLSKGEKIGRILSSNELEVRFELPEADYGRFIEAININKTASKKEELLGRSLQIVWKLGARKRTYKATLSRIGAEIDSNSGGIEMFASIDSVNQLSPRSGAFVEILFPDFSYENVFKIPVRAITEKNCIYVVRDQRLVEVPIEIVSEISDGVLARAKIKSGESIVSRLFENIGPGLLVKVL